MSDKDLATFSQFVLKCKQAKFAARDRERLRRQGDLRAELEQNLEIGKQRDLEEVTRQFERAQLGQVEASERNEEILANFDSKIADLRAIFAAANPTNHQPREVPDYVSSHVRDIVWSNADVSREPPAG